MDGYVRWQEEVAGALCHRLIKSLDCVGRETTLSLP